MAETDRYVALLAEADEAGVVEEGKPSETRPPLQKAGMIVSVINLAAAVLGAGMLGLPYGFAEAGWALGLVLLLGSGILSAFTMHLLSVVSQKVGEATGNVGRVTFYMLAAEALPGKWGTTLVECTVIANVFGLATSYLVVFGSTMPYVVSGGVNTGAVASSTYLWVSIALVFVSPMAFAPSLEALSFTSTFGMIAVLYIVTLVAFYFLDPADSLGLCSNVDDDVVAEGGTEHCGGKVEAAVLHVGLLQMLSIVTFAYTAHVQLLTVANELKDYTQAKMDVVVACGVAICGVAYLVVGLGGYLAFGDLVNGNALLSYPTKAVGVAAARVAVSGLVGISYPLMCKPGRDSFLSLLANSEAYKDAAGGMPAYIGFTLGFLGLTYACAMSLVNNPNALDLILSLLGASTSTVIAYIVPPLVYATTHPEPHWKRTFAIAVLFYGIVSMPFTIAATFL